MHFHFNKRTFLVLVGLLLVVSLLVYPGGTNKVVAEGGNYTYIPAIHRIENSVATASTSVFGVNATWKYYASSSMPASNWNQTGYSDSAWPSGSAPLGYGNGDERTTVSFGSSSSSKYVTTYFRKTIAVTDAASVSALAMRLTVDDGAVAYLNGREIGRVNMPTGAVSYATKSSGCLSTKATPVEVAINPAILVNGNNTFAVELHQCSTTTGDATFSMEVAAAIGGQSGTNPTATSAPKPTSQPTAQPTSQPTVQPTVKPTTQPTQPPTTGHSFYVTTGGSSSGDGSSSRPWSLAYALKQPSAVRPGDTIWLRAGTYSGAFTVTLKGSSSAPITVRAYPGERVTLRNSNDLVMDIYGASYVNFWGLEIAGSESSRDSASYPSTYGIRVNQGVASSNIKFINMIVHDVQAMGFGWWQALTDSEIYGSLIYENGTTKLDHGVYVHNVNGTKYLTNNMIFDNASHGIHGYAETAEKGLNNIVVDGNTLFNNGALIGTPKRNILMGGLTPTNNPVITNNYTYYPGSSGDSLDLGYSAGSKGARVQNNYFAGGQFVVGGGASSLTLSGNYIYAPGGVSGVSTSTYSNNTWTATKPSDTRVFIRPNKYEPNRANITIYNWSKQSSVSISAASLSGVTLKVGATYELHNAQNFYGDVVTGTYNGTSIVVPMTNHSVAQPVGLSIRPGSTFPEFGAFILIGK